jgi:hypothetical protein
MKTMQTLAKVSRTRIPCPSTTHAANCLRVTHILSRRIRYKFDGRVKGLGGVEVKAAAITVLRHLHSTRTHTHGNSRMITTPTKPLVCGMFCCDTQ